MAGGIMDIRKAGLITGGVYHDFQAFTSSVKPLFEGSGYALVPIDALSLTPGSITGTEMICMYTCCNEKGPGYIDEDAAKALDAYVKNGGRILAVHSTTVNAKTNPVLRSVLGGVFVTHPPKCSFQVVPCYPPSPITEGVASFTLEDELYIEAADPGASIHMVALHESNAYPVVWSRIDGKGKVVHIALGHDLPVWENGSFRKLMKQAIEWLG